MQKTFPSGTKTSFAECWLKEWLFKLIRAASGITFLSFSPQLSTACGWRARVFLIGAFPTLWFEGKKESITLHFYAQLLHPLPCQTAVSTASLPFDNDLHWWLHNFLLSFYRFRSLLQTNFSDHDFLVWKVRNTHHGSRKHIYSDFRVVYFSLPSMRITSVLKLWKIKSIFHWELKCRNSHNFLQK